MLERVLASAGMCAVCPAGHTDQFLVLADILAPIWTCKHETARKVRRRIGTVMKWAVAQGYRQDNPAGEAITAALPKRSKHVRHMPALPHGEVAAAVATPKFQGLFRPNS